MSDCWKLKIKCLHRKKKGWMNHLNNWQVKQSKSLDSLTGLYKSEQLFHSDLSQLSLTTQAHVVEPVFCLICFNCPAAPHFLIVSLSFIRLYAACHASHPTYLGGLHQLYVKRSRGVDLCWKPGLSLREIILVNSSKFYSNNDHSVNKVK